MTTVLLILAAVLIWFSFKSFVGGLRYLAFFQTELAKGLPTWTPIVTVFCPCRGVDGGMDENLAAILRQDYPKYEVVFVVDDPGDRAVEVIEQAICRGHAEERAKLIIAPKATASAQKVENLREAVLHTDPRSEVFVTVDSDARPAENWLRYLVAPLANEHVGAASGYRWFISERPSFSSEMRSVWNASIASALGPNTRSNFCWGGSTAIRRHVFEDLNIRYKWSGALSDDFVVTRAVREAGLDIVHVPQALTATVEDCSFPELLEFTTRQMKITRVYMPQLWVMSFVGSAIFCMVMGWAFLIIMLSRNNVWPVTAAAFTLLLVSGFSIGKSWLRLKAVRLALPQYNRELARQSLAQNTLWILSPLLFLYNSVAPLLSRRMTWRGTTYELKSPTETVIIRD